MTLIMISARVSIYRKEANKNNILVVPVRGPIKNCLDLYL